MTTQEIKQAVDNGKEVVWGNPSYKVIKTVSGYGIKHAGGNLIGLTWADGKTLNGKEEEFYINESKIMGFKKCLNKTEKKNEN